MTLLIRLAAVLAALGTGIAHADDGGQQKMAALGRALMCGTRFLVLDEPFEGVAPALAQRLVEVIASLKKEGLAVLVSESDLQHSEKMVGRVVTIDRGSIITER